MAETKNNPTTGASGTETVDKESGKGKATATAAPGLFRLPKFFTQGAEAAAEEELAEIEEGVMASGTKPAPAAAGAAAPSNRDLAAIHRELQHLAEQVAHVNDRESALERVFDALHSELADYKNDFLYEHLKPVVRPLLFLFDSLEQFDGEVAMAETTMAAGAKDVALSPTVVRENVSYFRDQLVEALRVCEVTIMDPPKGAFNAKFHKAVDVVPVSPDKDGTIVRVVRSGWFLNGQLLRPAEVVVGKHRG